MGSRRRISGSAVGSRLNRRVRRIPKMMQALATHRPIPAKSRGTCQAENMYTTLPRSGATMAKARSVALRRISVERCLRARASSRADAPRISA